MLRPLVLTPLCATALAHDLFAGPGLRGAVSPKTGARFTVVKRDTGGLRLDTLTDRQKIQEGLELR